MKAITAPTLVMTGDEDRPCLEPALLMKRTIMSAALVVMPNTGHTINLEEHSIGYVITGYRRPVFSIRWTPSTPIDLFFRTVDAGRWQNRDPRAMSGMILGK